MAAAEINNPRGSTASAGGCQKPQEDKDSEVMGDNRQRLCGESASKDSAPESTSSSLHYCAETALFPRILSSLVNRSALFSGLPAVRRDVSARWDVRRSTMCSFQARPTNTTHPQAPFPIPAACGVTPC